jgi:hypothetical protein
MIFASIMWLCGVSMGWSACRIWGMRPVRELNRQSRELLDQLKRDTAGYAYRETSGAPRVRVRVRELS